MRLLLRLFLLLLILVPLSLAALVWFSLSDAPAVATQLEASPQDIEHGRHVIALNDPRSFPPNTEHTVRMSERDINLALNYLIRKFVRGGAQATVEAHRLDLRAAIALPAVPARPWVNVTARIEEQDGAPRIGSLSVGSVPVPSYLAVWAFEELVGQVGMLREYRMTSDMIRRLELRRGQASVRYLWQPDTLRALGTQLAGADGATLTIYYNHLLALQTVGSARSGSITELLKSMFALARQRSAQGDPVAENRALLLILGAWASERDIRKLVPLAQDKPAEFRMSLQQRRDFGQHFLVSAAIAAAGESGLSSAIGIYKEMSDSRGGSGFSFTDIAADRAGTRFGKLATASGGIAQRLQEVMIRGVTEGDIMPPVRDLPEGLTEAEFQRRYTAVGSPAYQQMLDEIDRRISACALYRG